MFTDLELADIQTLSPLPATPRPDPTNAYADDPAAAILGQMLFFDKELSGPISPESTLGIPGEIHKANCGVCHTAENWFSDITHGRTPMGLNGYEEVNNLSLVNVGFNKWDEWEVAASNYWSQAMEDMEGALNGTRLELAHVLFNKYRAEYDAIFPEKLPDALSPTAPDADRFPATGKPMNAWEDAGELPGEWETMTVADQNMITRVLVNYGKLIQAFERVLVSRNAPFDRYVAGADTAISEAAKNGLKIFVGKGNCISCHRGPMFSDDKFHNTTVPAVGDPSHGIPLEDQTGFYDGMQEFLTGALSAYNDDSAWSDDPTAGKMAGLKVENRWQYAFRTQSLRQVAETYPYMHSGQFATLRDVVVFYSKGGTESGYAGVKDREMIASNLSETEIDDVVAFLKTLTGDRVDAALITDTSR
jgi:cytochrome c peroxidase